MLNLTTQNLLIFIIGAVVAIFLYIALLILERAADAVFALAEQGNQNDRAKTP